MSKLTKIQELELIDLYNKGVTTKDLCLKYGWSLNNRHGPLRILKKHNIAIRMDNETHAFKYTINDNYFSIIDTNDKAYFLGLLYADGSINIKKSVVNLSLTDKEIMLIFNKYLNSNKPLRLTEHSFPWKTIYKIYIENRKINTDLKNLGLIPNKSNNNHYIPCIKEEYLSHFIRGYFDGNGCITYSKFTTKKGKNVYEPVVNFTGHISIITDIKNLLHNKLNLNLNKFQNRYKHNLNSGSVSYGGINVCKIIYDYLYKDCDDLFIERKYIKFSGLLKGDFEVEKL